MSPAAPTYCCAREGQADIILDMATLFIILTAFFMAATLVTLGIGVVGMGKGGEFNKQNANRLMRLRVMFQGLAIASFLLWLLVR